MDRRWSKFNTGEIGIGLMCKSLEGISGTLLGKARLAVMVLCMYLYHVGVGGARSFPQCRGHAPRCEVGSIGEGLRGRVQLGQAGDKDKAQAAVQRADRVASQDNRSCHVGVVEKNILTLCEDHNVCQRWATSPRTIQRNIPPPLETGLREGLFGKHQLRVSVSHHEFELGKVKRSTVTTLYAIYSGEVKH